MTRDWAVPPRTRGSALHAELDRAHNKNDNDDNDDDDDTDDDNYDNDDNDGNDDDGRKSDQFPTSDLLISNFDFQS